MDVGLLSAEDGGSTRIATLRLSPLYVWQLGHFGRLPRVSCTKLQLLQVQRIGSV